LSYNNLLPNIITVLLHFLKKLESLVRDVFIKQPIYSGKPDILTYFRLLKASSGKIHHVHLHKYYQLVTNYQSTQC